MVCYGVMMLTKAEVVPIFSLMNDYSILVRHVSTKTSILK